MGEVVLHAIGIDEVRELCSGSAGSAAHLTALAAAAFPPDPPRAVGLLGKLGPLLRRPPDAPVIRPGVPTQADLTDLVHGRDLSPDRVSAGWALVRLWLDDRAWGSLALSLPEAHLDDLDFALAGAGVEPRLALRTAFNDQLSLPLKPMPGQVTGYLRHARATAMARAWRPVVARLPADLAATAGRITDWLDTFPGWADAAAAAARPVPDLVACWQSVPAG